MVEWNVSKHDAASAARRLRFSFGNNANMLKLKWIVPEVLQLHHCSSFGASSSRKATNDRRKVIQKACTRFIFPRIWITRTKPLSGTPTSTGSRVCKKIEWVRWFPHIMPLSNILILLQGNFAKLVVGSCPSDRGSSSWLRARCSNAVATGCRRSWRTSWSNKKQVHSRKRLRSSCFVVRPQVRPSPN